MSEFAENENHFEDYNVILPNNSDTDNIRKLSPNTTSSPTFKLNKIENLNDFVLHTTDRNDVEGSNLQINNDEVSSCDESHNNIVQSNSETTPERISREQRESEQLAWELTQQENLELYNLQLQFMQENAEHLNQDDLLLMQSIVNEATIRPNQTQHTEELEGVNDDNENPEDETESNPDEWDYERLLALGQQIGDVKTERWRLRAKSVIENLPKILYKNISKICKNEMIDTDINISLEISAISHTEQTPSHETSLCNNETHRDKDESSSSNKKICVRNDLTVDEANNSSIITAIIGDMDRCVVCMDNFEECDEVLMLPCQHYFHIACTEGWLADHNFCPCCKKKVTSSP